MTGTCPFCSSELPMRTEGPWPFPRHDTRGNDASHRAGALCPGSRSVLPLTGNPWAALATEIDMPPPGTDPDAEAWQLLADATAYETTRGPIA